MNQEKSRGFTLLELLIVIAVLAILSVVVVLVLNPAEILRKARDSQRMSDLNTIKTAIGLYITATPVPYLGVGGTTNTGCAAGVGHYIWYSLAGVSGTTRDGGSGTAVSPVSQASAGSVDGNGWIPVNLAGMAGGSPISNWPVDPSNAVVNPAVGASTDLVYRYSCLAPSMMFEVNAALESDAYKVQDNKLITDGGNNTNLYEVGSSLTILGAGTDF